MKYSFGTESQMSMGVTLFDPQNTNTIIDSELDNDGGSENSNPPDDLSVEDDKWSVKSRDDVSSDDDSDPNDDDLLPNIESHNPFDQPTGDHSESDNDDMDDNEKSTDNLLLSTPS